MIYVYDVCMTYGLIDILTSIDMIMIPDMTYVYDV